jgi:N-acetylneuraminate lyase
MEEKLARGILPALCTPFDESGRNVVPSRVAPLVDHLIQAGAGGFFVCGSTGEGKAMTTDERRQIAEAAVGAAGHAVPVIVQVGATSTENAVELARHAATAGADAVASVAPMDAPSNLEAAVGHYAAIGGATELPFYVYWLAQDADRSVSAEEYLEAMAGVPNFAGIKFTDSNFYFFQQLVDLAGDECNMITGPDEMCVAGMVMGSDAAIGSTYNIMPGLFVRMRQAFESGDIRSAMAAQVQANRVIRLLFKAANASAGTGGLLAALKHMLDWRGLHVGPPRITGRLDEAGLALLRSGLDGLGFDVA